MAEKKRPRLAPLPVDAVPDEVAASLVQAEQMMGFQANDALTMARNPALTANFGALVSSLYQPGSVPLRTKRLVGYMASTAAGCFYCRAHTSHSALGSGISEQELSDIWSYETSAAFSVAERCALRIAHHAALTPNAVTDDMYAEFANHFNAEEQVELVGIVSLFGFLNRWNSTIGTNIEAEPGDSFNRISSTQGSDQRSS